MLKWLIGIPYALVVLYVFTCSAVTIWNGPAALQPAVFFDLIRGETEVLDRLAAACASVSVAMLVVAGFKAAGKASRLPGTPGGLAGAGLLSLLLLCSVVPRGVVVRMAQDRYAQDRIRNAVAMVEAYRGSAHRLPTGAEFVAMWQAKSADDYDRSPWGGKLGPDVLAGTVALAPMVGDRTSATSEGGDSAGVGVDPRRAGALLYMPISAGPKGPWRALRATSNGHLVAVRDYAVGIYDSQGVPWWDVAGGR